MEYNLDQHLNRDYVYALWEGTYTIDYCNQQGMGSSYMGQKY